MIYLILLLAVIFLSFLTFNKDKHKTEYSSNLKKETPLRKKKEPMTLAEAKIIGFTPLILARGDFTNSSVITAAEAQEADDIALKNNNILRQGV